MLEFYEAPYSNATSAKGMDSCHRREISTLVERV